jgi:hypothetical protein
VPRGRRRRVKSPGRSPPPPRIPRPPAPAPAVPPPRAFPPSIPAPRAFPPSIPPPRGFPSRIPPPRAFPPSIPAPRGFPPSILPPRGFPPGILARAIPGVASPHGARRTDVRRRAARQAGLGRLGLGELLVPWPGYIPGAHRRAQRHLHCWHKLILLPPVSPKTRPPPTVHPIRPPPPVQDPSPAITTSFGGLTSLKRQPRVTGSRFQRSDAGSPETGSADLECRSSLSGTTAATKTTQATKTQRPLRFSWRIRASGWIRCIMIPPIHRHARIHPPNQPANRADGTNGMRDGCNRPIGGS